jgi:hypothetical protein
MEAGELLGEPLNRDQRHLSVWRGLCSVGLVLAVSLLRAPASIAATSADTAATYTYLLATYQLEQAIVHNAAASQADVASLAAGLGRECQGVLNGSPNEAEGPAPERAKAPRARGEHDRSEKQLQTINSEIYSTIGATVYEPDRSAVDEYVARISPLRWSDSQITALVQLDTSSLQQTLTPPVANVCTDMKTWADSGYHVLSQSSREFEAAQTARSNKASAGSTRTLTALLKPYVQRSGQALIRILAAPGASVLARTATGLVPLSTVPIAPDLHSGGPLVYGVFSTLPSELVVLGSDGSTLYIESLAAKGKEEAEFCEGYEER